MITLTTQAELRAVKHEEGVCFLCDDCKQTKPVQTSGGTGYAFRPKSDKPICYPCADKRQIEDLKDRSQPFVAYLSLVSKDSYLGYKITTWTGGELMKVTSARPCELTRMSFTHSRNGYMSVHAVDVHGGHWHGRGSEGIAIKLRPCKG